MAQSNVAVAAEKLAEEQKALNEALLRTREAQNKYQASLENEKQQEARFRKELNLVTEAIKQLDQLR